jgi:hypothetical protein
MGNQETPIPSRPNMTKPRRYDEAPRLFQPPDAITPSVYTSIDELSGRLFADLHFSCKIFKVPD